MSSEVFGENVEFKLSASVSDDFLAYLNPNPPSNSNSGNICRRRRTGALTERGTSGSSSGDYRTSENELLESSEDYRGSEKELLESSEDYRGSENELSESSEDDGDSEYELTTIIAKRKILLFDFMSAILGLLVPFISLYLAIVNMDNCPASTYFPLMVYAIDFLSLVGYMVRKFDDFEGLNKNKRIAMGIFFLMFAGLWIYQVKTLIYMDVSFYPYSKNYCNLLFYSFTIFMDISLVLSFTIECALFFLNPDFVYRQARTLRDVYNSIRDIISSFEDSE